MSACAIASNIIQSSYKVGGNPRSVAVNYSVLRTEIGLLLMEAAEAIEAMREIAVVSPEQTVVFLRSEGFGEIADAYALWLQGQMESNDVE